MNRPRRVNSNTANNTMNGKLVGKPVSQWIWPTYLVAREAPTPTTRPPAKVRGMEEKRPMAAAPKAWMTR